MSEAAPLRMPEATELDEFEREYGAVVALLDKAAALRYAVGVARQAVDVEVSIAGEVTDDDHLVLRASSGTQTEALHGLRIAPGTGLGGRVAVLRHPIRLGDYCTAPCITHDFDDAIRAEGIRGVLAVPMCRGHQFYGVLYAGRRIPWEFSDDDVHALMRIGRQAALAIEIADRAQDMTLVAVEEERNRIALALHDSVGAALFGIAAAARDLVSAPDLGTAHRARVEFVEAQAMGGARSLRQALRALSETPRELVLAVALKFDARAFQDRTGIETRTVVLGEIPALDPGRSAALLETTREALFNIEKHARASSVVISVFQGQGGVAVAIVDDGIGLGPGGSSDGLGTQAMKDRMARVGGSLTLTRNDDHGSTVRAWVPC